jgi:molybdenum cofactor cytidylyltransferase
MGSSIQVGLAFLESLGQPLEAMVVTLCDQPLVTSQLLAELVKRSQLTGALIVAAEYNGTHGVPALFARSVFPALRELHGAAGARQIIAAQGSVVETIRFEDAALDVDTRDQYEELLRRYGAEDGF